MSFNPSSAIPSITNRTAAAAASSATLSRYAASSPLSALKSPMAKKDPELHFPEELDEIDHFMTIRAFETEQISRRDPTKQKHLSSIRLPLPGNLATAYNINYLDNDFVGLGNFILEAFSEQGSQADRQAINDALAEMGVAGAAGAVIGQVLGGNPITGAIAGATGAALFGSGAQAGLGEGAAANLLSTNTLGQALLANRGYAINPHKVLMFQNVGFRTHQFNFQFTPKSYREAVALKQIIFLLKYHSSPSFPTTDEPLEFNSDNSPIPRQILGVDTNVSIDVSQGKHFFKYPDYFTIEFNHPAFLFTIAPSVIESFNVDYHPMGMPTYNREGGAEPTPSQINISMSFKETEIITKETVKKFGR